MMGFISALPEEFRDVLVAVDVAGLSYKEASDALGVPEGTMMSRLYRARKRVVDGVRLSRAAQKGISPLARQPASSASFASSTPSPSSTHVWPSRSHVAAGVPSARKISTGVPSTSIVVVSSGVSSASPETIV